MLAASNVYRTLEWKRKTDSGGIERYAFINGCIFKNIKRGLSGLMNSVLDACFLFNMVLCYYLNGVAC